MGALRRFVGVAVAVPSLMYGWWQYDKFLRAAFERYHSVISFKLSFSLVKLWNMKDIFVKELIKRSLVDEKFLNRPSTQYFHMSNRTILIICLNTT